MKQRTKFFAILLLTSMRSLAYGQLLIPKVPGSEGELDHFVTVVNTTTLPQITTLNRCTRVLDLLTTQYAEIIKSLKGKKPSPGSKPDSSPNLSVTVRYEQVRDSNMLILGDLDALVLKFSRAKAQQVTEAQILADHYRGLQQEFDQFFIKVRIQSDQETLFLNYLNILADRLRTLMVGDVHDFQFVQQPFCMLDSDIRKYSSILVVKVIKTLGQINAIYDLLYTGKQKRTQLINYAYQALDLSVKNELFTALKTELGAISKDLTTRLSLENIRSKYTGMTILQEILEKGSHFNNGHKLAYTYYQYENAVRQYGVDIQVLRELIDQLEDLKGQVADNELGSYRDKLAGMIAQMLAAKSSIEAGGWEKQRDKQLLMVSRRLAIADKYTAECHPLLEKYLQLEKNIRDQKNFAVLEGLFIRITDQCKGK